MHDTLFPGPYNQALLTVAVVRYAYDTITVQQHEGQSVNVFQVVGGEPDNPQRRFTVRVVPEQANHPIVAGVEDFEVGDEFWASNTALGVKPLLFADVGDRIPCHPRFQEPLAICGCLGVEKEKVSFLLLGHFRQTYENANIAGVIERAVRWLGGQLVESGYAFDVFLSFSKEDRVEAEKLRSTAEAKGLSAFFNDYSHSSAFSLANMTILSQPGSLVPLGSGFDADKVGNYRKEIVLRISACKVMIDTMKVVEMHLTGRNPG